MFIFWISHRWKFWTNFHTFTLCHLKNFIFSIFHCASLKLTFCIEKCKYRWIFFGSSSYFPQSHQLVSREKFLRKKNTDFILWNFEVKYKRISLGNIGESNWHSGWKVQKITRITVYCRQVSYHSIILQLYHSNASSNMSSKYVIHLCYSNFSSNKFWWRLPPNPPNFGHISDVYMSFCFKVTMTCTLTGDGFHDALTSMKFYDGDDVLATVPVTTAPVLNTDSNNLKQPLRQMHQNSFVTNFDLPNFKSDSIVC